MKEQKSANEIQFISLEDYVLQKPASVSFIHSREKQFYYSYASEDLQNPAVLHKGEKRKEHVVCIKDAICFAESEVILLDKQHAYHEFKNISCLQGIAECCDYRILVKDTLEEYEIKVPTKSISLPKGVYLSGLFSENYYHFVFSIISKTELLEFVPKDVPLLVDNNVKKYESYQSLLKICNRDNREIIFIDSKVSCHVGMLYLISLPFFLAPNVYPGVVDKPEYTQFDIELLQKFRNRILASIEINNDLPKRIFLSRKNASFRRPFNEYECQQLLKTYGIETIYPEELTFEQQVQIFHNAEVIAGGSGAAFTNLLYCSEACKVIMFIGYKISMSFWQPLVCLNNASYYRIHDRSKGELTQDNHPYDIHNPFFINPDDIVELMSQLGIKQESVPPKTSDLETVTVSVLTCNSSKTVLETLDSIKAQTYPYLNLNICDDCSTDSTIKLCKKWVKDNHDRFQNVKIATSFKNFGVAFNCNRSLDLCETKYMKEIASDDILEKDCISHFLQYAMSNPTAAICFSKVRRFGVKPSRLKKIPEQFDYKYFMLNTHEQIEYLLLKKNVIPAASAFYNVDMLRQMKLRNDERIPALEDWPKWLNYLKAGGRFGFLDEELVDYRVGNGVSTGAELKTRYLFSNLKFELLYRVPTIMSRDEKTIDNYVNYLFDLMYVRDRKHLKTMQKLIYVSVGLLLIVLYLLYLVIRPY